LVEGCAHVGQQCRFTARGGVRSHARAMSAARRLLWSASLALGCATAAVAAPNELVQGSAEDEAAVVLQVRKAMGLLDAGEHGIAWDQASKALQDVTPRLAFIAGTKSIRLVLGSVKGRTFQGIGFTKDLQGAPPGHYAGVLVRTDFENATAVEEKFILFNQAGQWRLAGYFVKKRRSSSSGATQ